MVLPLWKEPFLIYRLVVEPCCRQRKQFAKLLSWQMRSISAQSTSVPLQPSFSLTVTMRNKEVETYEVNSADLGHGVASLEGAISDIEAGGGALLQTKKTIRKAAILADALDLSPKHQRAIA